MSRRPRKKRVELVPYSTDAAICAVPACPEPSITAGYCEPHYLRSRLGQDMDAPVRRRHEVPKVRLLPRIRG